MRDDLLKEYVFTTKIAAEISGSTVADIAIRRKQGLLQGGELRGRKIYYSAADIVWIYLMQQLMQERVGSNTASVAGKLVADVAADYMPRLTSGIEIELDIYVVILANENDMDKKVSCLKGSDALTNYIAKNKEIVTVIPVMEKTMEIVEKLSLYVPTEEDDDE